MVVEGNVYGDGMALLNRGAQTVRSLRASFRNIAVIENKQSDHGLYLCGCLDIFKSHRREDH